ncbi:hypothetical protein ACFPN4_10820 [Ureibacillus thermophilus]|uniref:hypothetical protein n=1 Tax=Ureibacillus TaxID=160795 RepID=UPI0031595CCE
MFLEGEFTVVSEEEAEKIKAQSTSNNVEAQATCYQIRECCYYNSGCFGEVIDWDNRLTKCRCSVIIA